MRVCQDDCSDLSETILGEPLPCAGEKGLADVYDDDLVGIDEFEERAGVSANIFLSCWFTRGPADGAFFGAGVRETVYVGDAGAGARAVLHDVSDSDDDEESDAPE